MYECLDCKRICIEPDTLKENNEKYKNITFKEIGHLLYDEGKLCGGCIGENMNTYPTGLCEGIWCDKQIKKWLDEEISICPYCGSDKIVCREE